ncbi:MAG: hypothetical protein C6Y22_22825 [Hapalosiphonaceae cyanobacterium JJU2]|nr:MAG: hypothetical protein C6Y22_22825 [Hapalosiphonaceae cyanobacterium JJU2]
MFTISLLAVIKKYLMAIFSRRILQRLLDENSNFLTESQNLINIIQPNNFTEHLFNYCENKLIEGRLIKEFIMLNNFKENEDWVEIKFGRKDVAISKFYDTCKAQGILKAQI